jgi:serralysin
MTAVSTYSLTGQVHIDALLGGLKWATNSLTYSFPTTSSSYGLSYGSGEMKNMFGSFNATQQSAVRSVLKLYSSVADLSFKEVSATSTQQADLRFARSDAPSTAWAYFPNTNESGGDVWVNNSSGRYANPQKGNYAYFAIMHEIGHALGLEHPHEGRVMPSSRDSLEYTVMSYRSYAGATATGYTNETWGYTQSLMMYDIAALQHMYGANYTVNSDRTKYSWSPTTGEMFINGVAQGAPGGNKILQTVWDGGGSDTYDFSSYATALTINLQPGAWTTTSFDQRSKLYWDGSKVAAGTIANALLSKGNAQSLIENALGGSASDSIKGNAAANTLRGYGGNDKLYGDNGNDTLHGGSGNDWLYGQGGRDLLIGHTGADTFVFKSVGESRGSYSDTVQDFKSGMDHIDLRSIDANINVVGDQAFGFIGGVAFTGRAGELRFEKGVLAGDVNGDKATDFQVYVPGATALAKGDFYL